jgi:D-3-phosphoglycerate dehydrogenase
VRAADYAFEIGVAVTTNKESHRVAGTLFGKNDPRICSIDGMRVDAKPEGWMLVCMNEDKPLIIGRVGTIIGEAGINIANLMLGRDVQGGRALTVLNLDAPIGEEVMDRIRRVPHVTDARLVAL